MVSKGVSKTMKEKENQNIEWKSSWKDEYLKWICGYANAQGGTLYIGTDDDGNVVGIDNAKEMLDNNCSNYKCIYKTKWCN